MAASPFLRFLSSEHPENERYWIFGEFSSKKIDLRFYVALISGSIFSSKMTRVISTSFVIMNVTTKIQNAMQCYLQSRAGSFVETQTNDATNLLKEMFY